MTDGSVPGISSVGATNGLGGSAMNKRPVRPTFGKWTGRLNTLMGSLSAISDIDGDVLAQDRINHYKGIYDHDMGLGGHVASNPGPLTSGPGQTRKSRPLILTYRARWSAEFWRAGLAEANKNESGAAARDYARLLMCSGSFSMLSAIFFSN